MLTKPLKRPLIDIAVNLTDCVFRGIDWKGRQVHQDDFDAVVQRARDVGVTKIIVSGTNLEQCERAIALCKLYPQFLYCTVGVHPAHCAEFLRPLDVRDRLCSGKEVTTDPPKGRPTIDPSPEDEDIFATQRLLHLRQLVDANRDVVVAVGEIGLDGAELQYCSMDLQLKYFRRQLKELAEPLQLPLFLHSRQAGLTFVDVMREFDSSLSSRGGVVGNGGGVVHSFNGSDEELQAVIDLGLYVGLNASAFRTEGTARACCEKIPLNRLMLETDAPWCDARKTDFGFPFIKTHFDTQKRSAKFVHGKCVERRNEPCHLVQVLEAYCGARMLFDKQGSCAPCPGLASVDNIDEMIASTAETVFQNCRSLFFPSTSCSALKTWLSGLERPPS